MTKSELVHKIKSFIPKSCVLFYRKQKRHFYWQWQQGAYRRAVHKLQHSNKPLNVIFLVQNLTEWKCDSVYQLMAKDPAFNPTIFLCPLIKDTKEEGDKITQRAFDVFSNRGYHVIRGYDEINDASTYRLSRLISYSTLHCGQATRTKNTIPIPCTNTLNVMSIMVFAV